MKFISMFLMLLLFTSSAFAASGSGNVSNVVSYGGAVTGQGPGTTIPASSVTNQIVLYAGGGSSTITSADFYILYNNGSAYQVTAGKTFVASEILYFDSFPATSQNDGFQFVTGTAALGSNATATPPTGVVYYGGASGNKTFSYGQTVTGYTDLKVPVSFAATLYPCIQAYVTSSSPYMNWIVIGTEN